MSAINDNIIIKPIVNYNAILNMYGKFRAPDTYSSMIDSLQDIINSVDVASTTLNLSQAIDLSSKYRALIIERNDSSLVPIPVLRICILLTTSTVLTSECQQESSFHRIPIFISSEVIKDPLKCTIKGLVLTSYGSLEGYYYYPSDEKSTSLLNKNDRVIFSTKTYLVAIKNAKGFTIKSSYSTTIGDTQVFICTTTPLNMLQEIYKKNTSVKIVAHVCEDILIEKTENIVRGNGINIVLKLLDSIDDKTLCLTQCFVVHHTQIKDFSSNYELNESSCCTGNVYLYKQGLVI